MKSVLIERPREWDHVRLVPLSDIHIGAPEVDLDAVQKVVNDIAADPNALVILNGDIMNCAIKSSVSDVYAETMKPSRQLESAAYILAPIRRKIIGATCGNHEGRIYKNDGVDMIRLLCRELGCEDVYSPESVLVFLSFGEGAHHGGRKPSPVTYSIYATHGAGGGRKEGGKINRLADLAGIVDADIYIHSHTHLPAVLKENFFRVDVPNKSVREVTKCFVNTAAALNYGGYGEAQSYKPASIAFPEIILAGDSTKNIKAVV